MTPDEALTLTIVPLLEVATVLVVGPWRAVDQFLEQIARDVPHAEYNRSHRVVRAGAGRVRGIDESKPDSVRGLSATHIVCLRPPPKAMADNLELCSRSLKAPMITCGV